MILVSAQGPNPSFFLFLGDFYSTWSLLGPGFGPGLDNLTLNNCLFVLKVAEIDEILEMKITHRKNLTRRKAKFG